MWGREKAIWPEWRGRGAEVFVKTLPNKAFLPDNFPGGEKGVGSTWRRERNWDPTLSEFVTLISLLRQKPKSN